ncbi:C-type lectin domain family 5 member A isoform X4 [Ovis aries]|uniref:C-type lectin domain family 5 member A isoform X4 n=1 Tax=Ovis aries TaxID=9940 RepID=UPI001C2E61C5|nr:C-type lectin domain family 5 member A isoform X4 [Ovis aries]
MLVRQRLRKEGRTLTTHKEPVLTGRASTRHTKHKGTGKDPHLQTRPAFQGDISSADFGEWHCQLHSNRELRNSLPQGVGFSSRKMFFLVQIGIVLEQEHELLQRKRIHVGHCQHARETGDRQELRVQSLDWEDPLEEEMATHSSILAWRIPMDRGA